MRSTAETTTAPSSVRMGAMDVAGKQGGAGLPLEFVNSPAYGVNGELQPLGRGAETAASHHFQENPGGVPVGETAEGDLMAFLQWNAPFQCERHTRSLPSAKLGRICLEVQPGRVYYLWVFFTPNNTAGTGFLRGF